MRLAAAFAVAPFARLNGRSMAVVRCSIAVAAALLAGAPGCGGTTGSDHVTFHATAAGPADATGGPLSFTSALGWQVTLTKATLHVGGLYLNQTVPLSGRQASGCYLPSVYVAEVLGAVDVDLLSPTPTAFPVDGDGMAVAAHVAEVWLTGGAIDATSDATVLLDVEGTATRDASTIPFTAALTISDNRQVVSTDPTMPSARPLCLERIVGPLAVDLTPSQGGTLGLRVDPRRLFWTVDFSTVPADAAQPGHHRFADTPTNDADIALYRALHATAGVYSVSFAGGQP